MSGLQSSISTHIARKFLNASTNSWGENPDLFMKAVGNHPDRLQVVFEMQFFNWEKQNIRFSKNTKSNLLFSFAQKNLQLEPTHYARSLTQV